MKMILLSALCSNVMPKGFHLKNNRILFALKHTIMNGTASKLFCTKNNKQCILLNGTVS